VAGFDAAMFNTLKDIRERQDRLISEQHQTNVLLAQLIQVMQGQPRQWYPEQQPPMAAGPWPPVPRG